MVKKSIVSDATVGAGGGTYTHSGHVLASGNIEEHANVALFGAVLCRNYPLLCILLFPTCKESRKIKK